MRYDSIEAPPAPGSRQHLSYTSMKRAVVAMAAVASAAVIGVVARADGIVGPRLELIGGARKVMSRADARIGSSEPG